jgi:hypothetical protein
LIRLKTSLVLSGLILVLAAPAGIAQERDIPELTEPARAYFYRLQAIKAPAEYKQVSLRPRYLQQLGQAEAQAKIAGNLELVLAIQEEVKRFSSDPTFKPRKDKGPPEVTASRTPYMEGMQRLYDAEKPALAGAAQQYAQLLEGLVKQFTQAGRIEDAQYVRSQIGRIPGITGARDSHPMLYPGKSARSLTAAELQDELTGTRWRLSWLRGKLVGEQSAFLEFYPGRIYRIVLGDGSEKRGYYRADDRRRLELDQGNSVYFDASFSALNLHLREERSWQFGQADGPIHARPAEDNFLKDLIVYYPFDELGPHVVDKSPQGYHGTGFDTMLSWAGKRKNAAYFTGRSHVELEGKIDPDDYAELSISLWAKATGAFNGAYLIHWTADEENGGTYIKFSRGTLYYAMGAGREELEFAPRDFRYKPGTWYHIVMTHDRHGGNVLYVDGKRIASHLAYPLKGNSARLSIGSKVDLPADEVDPELIGLIDDLMIFKRALSPVEVQTLYAAGE